MSGTSPRRGSSSRGQVLAGVILLMIVLLISVPMMVSNLQRESRWSVKEKRSTTAFHLAEAAIDRAVWKLNEDSENWANAATGTNFAGYNNDVTYTDLPGGSYRVDISSGNGTRKVRIIGTGRDGTSNEYRAIEAYYEAATVNAAIQAPSLQFNSSFKVFWGPYMSLTNISLNSSADELFPRKLARTSITSSSSYGDRDTSASAPNTDCLEYWAYNDNTCGSGGVPDIPAVDIEWYRAQAQIPPNEYYTANKVHNSLQDNVPKIRFYEANATFNGTTHFRGWLIGMQSVKFAASGYDHASYGSYTVDASSIPSDAWKEHQKNVFDKGFAVGGCASGCNGGGIGKVDDGNYDNDLEAEADDCCRDQYPGDAGYHTVESFNFKTGCVAHGQNAGHSGEPIAFKGFIYSGGEAELNSSTVIHGAIVAPGGFKGTSSGIMFYDNTIDVQMGSTYSRSYWKEVTPTTW